MSGYDQSLYSDSHGLYDDTYDTSYDQESDEPIQSNDVWVVISTYFTEQQGLVRQQLNSFDDFICSSIFEIIEEFRPIILKPQTEHLYNHSDENELTKIKISFGQLYLMKPTIRETHSNTSTPIHPHLARLCGLTYSANLKIDVRQETLTWKPALEEWQMTDCKDHEQLYLGKIPIMLRSEYCTTWQASPLELRQMGECYIDQGGYFIINGSEKVLLAHERMAANNVYVFKKSDSSVAQYSIVAEVRSQPTSRTDTTSRGRNMPPLPFYVKMKQKNAKQVARPSSSSELRIEPGEIMCEIPYVSGDMHLGIVFRGLGLNGDKQILEDICYDFDDTEMTDMLQPSFKASFHVQEASLALDFIGRRCTDPGTPLEKRQHRASEILYKSMLPHVGQTEHSGRRKAYFIGYMTHRLLSVALGRRKEDDRDHYGNKRLDLAGPLFSSLFRQLFRKLHKNTES